MTRRAAARSSRGQLAGLVLGATIGLGAVIAGCAEPAGQVDLASASAAATQLVSPIDGQVVKLDSEGLTKVRGLTLRTADGREVALTIGVVENGAVFPPGHLSEHMASGSPVRLWFRMENGVPVVYRIEDAPGG